MGDGGLHSAGRPLSSLGGALSFGARRVYPFLLFASSHLPVNHLSPLSDSREIQCRNSAPQMRFFMNAPGYFPRPYDERISAVVGRFEAIRSRLGMRALGTIFHGTLGGSAVSSTPQKRSPRGPIRPHKGAGRHGGNRPNVRPHFFAVPKCMDIKSFREARQIALIRPTQMARELLYSKL